QGEFDEVRRHAVIVRTLFPDDPLPAVVEALILMFESKDRESLAMLDSVKDKLGPQRHRRQREFIATLGPPLRAISGDGPRDPVAFGKLWAEYISLIGETKTLPFSFNVPTSAWLEKRAIKLMVNCLPANVSLAVGLPLPDLLFGLLRDSCDDSPE